MKNKSSFGVLLALFGIFPCGFIPGASAIPFYYNIYEVNEKLFTDIPGATITVSPTAPERWEVHLLTPYSFSSSIGTGLILGEPNGKGYNQISASTRTLNFISLDSSSIVTTANNIIEIPTGLNGPSGVVYGLRVADLAPDATDSLQLLVGGMICLVVFGLSAGKHRVVVG